MNKLACVLLLWCNASGALFAAEQFAKYEEGSYYLDAKFTVEASAEEVISLLTDYENIAQLHPSIVESEILDTSKEDRTKIRTVVKDCVIFFCKEVVRVENVSQDGLTSIAAEVVPFLSDLRSGHTDWTFMQQGDVTTVTYQSSMQPKFWIPPFIRSHTVTKKLEKRIMEMVMRIQAKAPNYSRIAE